MMSVGLIQSVEGLKRKRQVPGQEGILPLDFKQQDPFFPGSPACHPALQVLDSLSLFLCLYLLYTYVYVSVCVSIPLVLFPWRTLTNT